MYYAVDPLRHFKACLRYNGIIYCMYCVCDADPLSFLSARINSPIIFVCIIVCILYYEDPLSHLS